MKHWKKNSFLICILLLSASALVGQGRKQDSLWAVFSNTAASDTNRLKAINDIVWNYIRTNPDTTIRLAELQLNLAHEKKQKKFEASAIYAQAIALKNKSSYDLAMQYNLKALKMYQEMDYPKGALRCFINIGGIYQAKADYPKALEYQLKALQIAEEVSDKQSIANCCGNIGIIYKNQFNYSKALEYQLRALKIREELGDKRMIGGSYQSIGVVYNEQHDYNKALEFDFKALAIVEAIKDERLMASMYNNIGIVYAEQKDYEKALAYSEKALALAKKTKDNNNIENGYVNLGELDNKLGKYLQAVQYGDSAIALGAQLGDIDNQRRAYNNLSESYYGLGQYKEAFQNHVKFKELNDSIFNAENSRQLGDLKTNFEVEKKAIELEAKAKLDQEKKDAAYEAEINRKQLVFKFEQEQLEQKGIQEKKEIAYKAELKQKQTDSDFKRKEAVAKINQEKEREIFALDSKRKNLMLWSVIIGLAFLGLFLVFVVNRLSITRKQKKIIEEQKEDVEKKKQEVELQKHMVEEHQKEIIDSITYAKRLQQAILPSDEEIKKYFPESFLLYLPKDIVAGDFYWMEHLDDMLFIAAADSTGHGVPGAMVSVVCSNAMNRAVKEFGLRDPGLILDMTRDLVLETFAKSGSDVKDGMDVSFLALNRKQKQILWSGANNPLWYVSNNELIEIKANKQPIGKVDNPQPFTTHRIEYRQGDRFYLMTDGYPDQFGGPKGKKFKYKPLEELILKNNDFSFEEQKAALAAIFDQWRGNLEQVDDVTIIGLAV